jgi:hypothetical protein
MRAGRDLLSTALVVLTAAVCARADEPPAPAKQELPATLESRAAAARLCAVGGSFFPLNSATKDE